MIAPKGCIAIGNGAQATEPGDIVFATEDNEVLFKADGRILHNGKEVGEDEDLVKLLRAVVWRFLKREESRK